MGSLRFVLGLLALSSFGCSSDDEGGEPIDCSWFAAPNCWKEVVDAAYACANAPEGTFDAARSQCTGTDVNVTFAAPVPTNLSNDETYRWDVKVSRAGTQCVHVVETEMGLDVLSSAGQVRQGVEGNNMILHCPDGSRYSIDAFAALGCGFDALPGYSWVQLSSSLTYELMGAGDHGDASPLFTCRTPPP
jgi:hypothetical protein